MKKYKVAILGATGAVGREMMKVLAERDFPIEELHLLASARSVGQAVHWKGHDIPVELACDEAFKGMDIVLGAAENDIAKQFAPVGGTARAYVCDVCDRDSVEDCHRRVLEQLGQCDLLINGAGGNKPQATTEHEYYEAGDLDAPVRSFFDLRPEDIESVLQLNFSGTLIPTQVFAQDMLGRGGCSILNISSMNAYTPLTKIPAYSGAKAAVSNLTQWLAVHFVKQGIRVNAIAPGFLSTQQNKTLLWNEDGSPTPRTGKILAATPMGRFGRPEELIGAVLFLLDDKAASFVTGVVLPIDGGFSAYSGV